MTLIQEKVSSVGGSIELLVALGFRVILEVHDTDLGVSDKVTRDKPLAAIISESMRSVGMEPWFLSFEGIHESSMKALYIDNNSDHHQIDQRLLSDIKGFLGNAMVRTADNIGLLAVSESAGYSMMIVMNEPCIDSGRQEELDRWTSWFDEVKACSDALNFVQL